MLRVTFNDGQPEFQGNFSDDLPPTLSPPETSFPSSKKRQRRLLGYSTFNNLTRAPHIKRTSSHFHLERLAHLRTHSPPSLPSPFPILNRVASTVVGRLHTRRVEVRTFQVTHRALLAVHFYPSHAHTADVFLSPQIRRSRAFQRQSDRCRRLRSRFSNYSIFEQTCRRNKHTHQHEKALGENGNTLSPEVRREPVHADLMD